MQHKAHVPKSAVTICLVEDDRAYRSYVATLLESEPGWKVSLQADSVEDAVRQGAKLKPKVLLLDIKLPGVSGASSVARFLKLWPDTSVVMLTGADSDDLILEAVRTGACGYVLKGASSDELTGVVKEVLDGGSPMSGSIAKKVLALLKTLPPVSAKPSEPMPFLTAREHEIVSLVAEGLSDKEIATRVNTAVPTVKNHLANVYAKWRVRSRAEAAVHFVRGSGA